MELLPNKSHATLNVSLLARWLKYPTATLNTYCVVDLIYADVRRLTTTNNKKACAAITAL